MVQETGEKKQSQVDLAFHKIGFRIISGSYPEDTALPIESLLVAELGVSRNSLQLQQRQYPEHFGFFFVP